MITDLKKLREDCLLELEANGYDSEYRAHAMNQWEKLGKWMDTHGHTCFSKEVAKLYCEETLGFFILPPNTVKAQRRSLRAIRLLVSFQESQSLETRSPRVDHTLIGPLAQEGEAFLRYLESLGRKEGTLEHTRYRLNLFLNFIKDKEGLPQSLGITDIEAFVESAVARKSGVGPCCTVLKFFFTFLYNRGLLNKNIAVLVPKVKAPNYRNKLPSTYSEEEIQQILNSPDRSSALGKRDYLVLLLASEYGLRASDIATIEFGAFDWDANTITHRMQKTGDVIKLPLLSEVGNALIDYVQNGRPETQAPQVIVRHQGLKRGQPYDGDRIYFIVREHIKSAGIKDWQKRRCGPHALRSSLATRLRQQNYSISVISQTLGHRSTRSTSCYVKVDIASLGKCPLPMPPLKSTLYTPDGHHGKL